MITYTVLKIVLFGSFLTALAQRGQGPKFYLKFDDLLVVQQGIGWPPQLEVFKGNEALMKLTVNPENAKKCEVTTPSGVTFDVKSPPNNRFEPWEDNCSVKVKNVDLADTGRWRLTASGDNDTVVGWTEVHVKEETPSPAEPPIVLIDGENDVKVDLVNVDDAYCLVAKPFSDSVLVPGHCSITLDRTSRAVQGNWNVLLGVPGRVEEVPLQREVLVDGERLDVGYVHDTNTNKLHLYCNIMNTVKNITFCRFQQTSKSFGYNVVDGLSDGRHSYYGKGFLRKECGITVENPTEDDFGTWRCSLGLKMWVGNQIKDQTPMQALISVVSSSKFKNLHGRNTKEEKTIFVQEDGPLTLSCDATESLSYCWFQHPNGSQFTPVPLVNDEQQFWYSGEGLTVGECGITFRHVNKEDSGIWKCHMGRKRELGIEDTDDLEVRVTGPLAANDKDVAVEIGEPTTLYCRSSNGNRPLQYCRFLTPASVGINIDSSVTEKNAILDKFYFTPGRSIDVGDCSLNINAVDDTDLGVWTCAAIVDDQTVEARDTIQVFISSESAPRLQAGVAGTIAGASILVIILVGFLIYKRRSSIIPLFNRNPSPPSDGLSLQRMSNSGSTTSSQSGSSNEFETTPRMP